MVYIGICISTIDMCDNTSIPLHSLALKVREVAPTPSEGGPTLPTPPMAPAERNKVSARGSSVPRQQRVKPTRIEIHGLMMVYCGLIVINSG